MKTPKHIIKGEQLKTRTASDLSNQQAPSEHQFKLWESYKDRAESTINFDKKAGEIWSTVSKPLYPEGLKTKQSTPRLVLILDSDGEVLFHKGISYHKILVAPVSTNIEMATEWDFIVQDVESPLGYPFMIELWNKVTMLAENLNQGLWKLDDQYLDHTLRLSKAETANLVDDSPPDSDMFKNNVGCGKVQMGNEIFHFQRTEIEDVAYLTQPVKALTEAISALTSDEQLKIRDSLKETFPKSTSLPPVNPKSISRKEKLIGTQYEQLMAGVTND